VKFRGSLRLNCCASLVARVAWCLNVEAWTRRRLLPVCNFQTPLQQVGAWLIGNAARDAASRPSRE
jgi:hypothetical protein